MPSLFTKHARKFGRIGLLSRNWRSRALRSLRKKQAQRCLRLPRETSEMRYDTYSTLLWTRREPGVRGTIMPYGVVVIPY